MRSDRRRIAISVTVTQMNAAIFEIAEGGVGPSSNPA